MTLQSTFYDPVIGLDMHLVAVPAPPTLVPVLVPMPFVGLIYDPVGLAVGWVMGAVLDGGPNLVVVNSMPVATCGTAVTNAMTMPHVSAPGIAFLSNGAPVKIGDAELFFGSQNVSFGGRLGVRFGDVALSCCDPVRLPGSMALSIPKGRPVLNRAPMVPDYGAMGMAIATHVATALLRALARAGARLFRALRRGSPFMAHVSHGFGGCHPSSEMSRTRRMWTRAVRVVTGHPIDVVSGNLFTDAVDASLPGPLPLTIERVYESAGSGAASTLGHGWSHTLDECLWMERSRAVLRSGDGRELEFPLWDLPDRRMRAGDVVSRVVDKLELRALGEGRFEVVHADGRVHDLAPVLGGKEGVSKLVRIRSEDRHHSIELIYDRRGLLEWVRDSGGRLLAFEHDEASRLVALKLPVPHGRGWYRHRQYRYDAEGDLVEVKDASGHSYRYVYASHLLVQETDRAGLSFYFQYDGVGASARCVRTWGDGGIYDHVVDYDVPNRKTFVRDSLGALTVYSYDVRHQVVSIVDPVGRTTRFEYDLATATQTAVIDPLGARSEKRVDARGNVVALISPTGAATSIEYEGYRPTRVVDPRGAEWRWRYDADGHLVERTLPTGERSRMSWERGLLVATEDAHERRVQLGYDEQSSVRTITLPGGGVARCEHDELGRPLKITSPREGVSRMEYDAEGRVVRSWSASGVAHRIAYDPEGNVIEAEDATRHVRLAYGHFHRVTSREEGGTELRFEYDTEDRVVGIVNQAGERYGFELDRAGEVREETGFDGQTRRYERDRAGRITQVTLPSGRRSETQFDAAGRPLSVTHSDGTFARFEYDACGDLTMAENESTKLELLRDGLGRVVVERSNGREVRSSYEGASRAEMTTSLGARVSMTRSALGEVEQLFFGGAFLDTPDVRFEHDGEGLERARRFSNGIDVEWERDRAGRPTARRTLGRFAGRLAAAAAVLAGPSLGAAAPRDELETQTYAWRGEDQIAAIVDAHAGARAYEHDGRGRLVRERRGDAVVDRAMDDVGNVFRSADGHDRRYGAGGRLESMGDARYEHDADGNQIAKLDADGSTWRYGWNGHGQLREVTRPDGARVRFEYDAFARRTLKRTVAADGSTERETRFVWDAHTVVHEEDSRTGLTTWHWQPESFAPIAKEHGARRWTLASDHLGTPTEMYDERGALVWQMQLDVFGAPSFTAGTAEDCPWRWPGQYEDGETGLSYNWHRHYDADQGRYVSQDPIRLAGGLALYGYVADSSTYVDPLGLACRPGTAEADASRGIPSAGSLTNQATRQWYHGQLSHLPSRIDSSLPLRDRALQAFQLRNQIKLEARALMADRALAESLPALRSVSDVVGRSYRRGLCGDALWQRILEQSTASDEAVDSALGVSR